MGRTVAIFLAIVTSVQIGLVIYIKNESQIARKGLVDFQHKGCERGKLDRKDNSDFQRAQAKYIKKVTGAKSVKEDVKIAAREARKVFVRTSRSLINRSKINCKQRLP